MPGKDFATNEIMPLWWNWQTRGTQNPVVAIPCRFDPDQRHHRKDGQGFILVRIFCGAAVNGDDAAKRKLIVIKNEKIAVVRQFALANFCRGSRRKRETAIPDQKLERAGQILVRLFCGAAFYNKTP